MPPAATELASAWDTETVAAFAEGGEDILVLPRRPPEQPEQIESAVRAARFHEYLVQVDRQNLAREVRAGLGEFQMRSPALASDLVGLVTSFLQQFGPSAARLRIEVTRSQPCPKFHSDNVHVRLVTTYVGPATEYQYSGENVTHVAPLNGLVFLKGHRHPTHRDSAHHRSPEVPAGERRLCVAIDYRSPKAITASTSRRRRGGG